MLKVPLGGQLPADNRRELSIVLLNLPSFSSR